MAPNAVARHRGAGAKGERDRTAPARVRYHRERAALASVLKNYSLFTLLWLLPLYFVQVLLAPSVCWHRGVVGGPSSRGAPANCAVDVA